LKAKTESKGARYVLSLGGHAVDGLETLVLDVLLKVLAERLKSILNAGEESVHPCKV